jgi:hypothetical protein
LQAPWPQSQVNVVKPFESSQKFEQYLEPGWAGQLQASWAHFLVSVVVIVQPSNAIIHIPERFVEGIFSSPAADRLQLLHRAARMAAVAHQSCQILRVFAKVRAVVRAFSRHAATSSMRTLLRFRHRGSP